MSSKLALFFMCSLISGSSLAGESKFECTITLAHAVDQDGSMVADSDHLISQIGNSFSVDRASGAVAGSYFLDSGDAEKVTVINQPSDNSYYAIYESYGPNKMVGYLYIANHRNWPTKPFTYTTSGEYIYSGYCE